LRCLRICSVRRTTPSTRIVRLELDAPFDFRAGQSASLGPDDSGSLVPFSIASSPEDSRKGQFLEFLIKVDAQDRWGEQFPPLRRGMRLRIKGPAGRFVFPQHAKERHFVFIAGGTGIAPLRAMLRHARAVGQHGTFSVLYSARTPEDFSYRGELRGMARRGEIQLLLTATRGVHERWRGRQGRITSAELASLISDPDDTLCFVCGPAAMVDEVPQLLRQLGVDRSKILLEDW
jgi:NAD(P)H-flavin reductase